MTRSVHSNRYERLRAALVSAREAADLTQAEVAKKLRRPQSYVSKYERGERRLDVVEFIEVADVLRVHPSQIIDHVRR